MRKIICCALFVVVLSFGAIPAPAQTKAESKAQINSLLAMVDQLQAQIARSPNADTSFTIRCQLDSLLEHIAQFNEHLTWYGVQIKTQSHDIGKQGEFAEPAGAELGKFPIKNKPLTVAEQADLGLSAKKLDKQVEVQNHFRNLRDKKGRFVLETLPAGTLVLVDKDGNLRYKADCGNRLVETRECPKCPPVTADSLKTSITQPVVNKPNFWQKLASEIKSAATGLWNFIGSLLAPLGWLLLLLLGLLLLALLAYLLYRLIRWIVDSIQNRNQGEGGEQHPPAQPIPPVITRPDPPAQPPVPPVVPQPNPPIQPPATPGPVPAPIVPVAPNPNPAPPSSTFPNRRVIIDFGGGDFATRIQSGKDINRIQYDRNPDDGSNTIRIFEN
jgi:hypothetical protein